MVLKGVMVMKVISKVTLLVMFALVSCRKKYTCICTWYQIQQQQTQNPKVDTMRVEFMIKGRGREEARSECKNSQSGSECELGD